MTIVRDCPVHPDCSVIESDGWPDVAGSWRSHFDNDVAPEARLNPDDPAQSEIEDRRSASANATLARRAPTQTESDRLSNLLTREGVWMGPVDTTGKPIRSGSEVRHG